MPAAPLREEFYYRLRVVPIEIPPLRQRRQDLELLIRHFLDKIGRDRGRSLRLAPSANRALLTYAWPGNVRELENALEYAISVCEGQTIHTGDLPIEIERYYSGRPSERGDEPPTASGGVESEARFAADRRQPQVGLTLAETEEVDRLRAALRETRYNRRSAAELLGMSRTTLWRKMKQFGL